MSIGRWFALGLGVIFLIVGISSCNYGGEGNRAYSAESRPENTALGSITESAPGQSDLPLRDRMDGPAGAPGEGVPSSDEELWVIGRSKSKVATDPGVPEIPGAGSLYCTSGGGPVALPLESTDVRARVLGFIASVDVAQCFSNPYDGKIEALYVFPLPEDAGVTGFVMSVGERRIRAVIREREEAERLYLRARAAGKVASLFTQERPNVFTQKVANIEPGRRIDVNISYFHHCRF